MKKAVIMMVVLISGITMTATAQNEKSKKDASSYASRFTEFVDSVARFDTLSVAQKAQVDSTYKAYLKEYKTVKDSMNDEDVRQCSKAKVSYQKNMARIFIVKASDDVADTAQGIGEKVSKVFKRTKKKVEGAIDALKND